MIAAIPRTRLAVAAVFFVAVLTVVPAAFAGKSGGKPSGGGTTGSGGSLTLVMVKDANGNGAPNWGDTVTFRVSTTATTQPMVGTTCWQNGAQAYYHEGGFYPGDPWAPGDQMFVLQSYGWTSGAATCTATLFYMGGRKGGQVTLATLNFSVGA